jgi:hypothetical protein
MSVPGIDMFRDYMKDQKENYAIIGGSACDLIFADVGVAFRPTADLDIVILTEGDVLGFGAALWSFIKNGGYTYGWRSSPNTHFYRFTNPTTTGFPKMLELFSRRPEHLLFDKPEIAPLHIDADISSLSAILMDADYYMFIRKGITVIRDLPIVDAGHLIPLKAKAHLDLNARKDAGEHVNSDDLKKHRKDVLRLAGLLPNTPIDTPASIRADMDDFIESLRIEQVRIDQLGISMTLDEVSDLLKRSYCRRSK